VNRGRRCNSRKQNGQEPDANGSLQRRRQKERPFPVISLLRWNHGYSSEEALIGGQFCIQIADKVQLSVRP
jgi:hypothetical protein